MSYPFLYRNSYETATPYTDAQLLEKGTREYNKDVPNYYTENPSSQRIDIKNICFRGEFKNHSQEELRIADYLIKKKNSMLNPTFSSGIGNGFFKPQFNANQINIGTASPFSFNAPTPVNNPFTQTTTQNQTYNPFSSTNTTSNSSTIFNPFQSNSTNNISNLFNNNNNNTTTTTNNIFSPFSTTVNNTNTNPFVIQATNISNANMQSSNPFTNNNNNTNIFNKNNNNTNTNIFNSNQTNFFQPQQPLFQSPTSNLNPPVNPFLPSQQPQQLPNEQSNFFTCYCCPIIPHSAIGESHIMKLNELNTKLYLERNKMLINQFSSDFAYQNELNESRFIFPK